MEAHCVNMEFKYQNQSLKDRQHGQILNEASNKAKIKKEIEVLETINIELEHSVAKLLADNEKLHKENEHLKQTYKDLYDSLKKTRVQTKDHNNSLIAQINSKTIENADLKAQIQEKVFENAALKNELRKNQSVFRQPNVFKSEQPNFSKARFASEVDANNDLPKPVTPHYLPKVRESILAKLHHVIVHGSSRNSSKESYGLIDMAHNYYLEEAKKKTQVKNRNLKPREMPSARTHHTPNACIPKPRSNNQMSRNWPASKRLVPNPPPLALFVPPSRHEWDLVFQLVFDEFFSPPTSVASLVPVEEAPTPVELTVSPSSTAVDQDAPSPKTISKESSSTDVIPTTMHSDAPILEHLTLFCYIDAFLTSVEPKTYKDALTQSCWIEAMQEELHEFKRLKVWKLIPRPDKVMVITLKWIFKQACPTKKHLHAVKRIFQYLRGTVNRGLWYSKDFAIALTAFADADHSGWQDVRRSSSRSMKLLRDRLVRWSSKRQKSSAISSTEAKYPAVVLNAIALCCNNVQHSRSKHIAIRYHFIKEQVENGVVGLYFVRTEYQLADIFTKALCRERIEFLIDKLGMRSFTPETLKELAD
ncbi:hypothetical protein Tco_1405272 [Tanacetum coccineum]